MSRTKTKRRSALIEKPFVAAGMLGSCYAAVGDKERQRRATALVVAAAEKAIAADPGNGYAMGFIVLTLAQLGEAERAKAWAERAVLLDPGNQNMRYNFACAFAQLNDADTTLDLLEPVLAQSRYLSYTKSDPDFDPIRHDPRFKTVIAAAEARLAKDKSEA